jgi:C_GCAxxG_C_C family probable redox protein
VTDDPARVAALHQQGGMNCSQAMLCVYGKYFAIPEETALKVAAAFGGGMGAMGKTCGAVTGAFMVLGLGGDPDSPDFRKEVYALVREFSRRFISRHGSISCSDLLGYDFSTEEGASAIREKKLTAIICPGLDRSAAEIVEELLGEKLK